MLYAHATESGAADSVWEVEEPVAFVVGEGEGEVEEGKFLIIKTNFYHGGLMTEGERVVYMSLVGKPHCIYSWIDYPGVLVW